MNTKERHIVTPVFIFLSLYSINGVSRAISSCQTSSQETKLAIAPNLSDLRVGPCFLGLVHNLPCLGAGWRFWSQPLCFLCPCLIHVWMAGSGASPYVKLLHDFPLESETWTCKQSLGTTMNLAKVALCP